MLSIQSPSAFCFSGLGPKDRRHSEEDKMRSHRSFLMGSYQVYEGDFLFLSPTRLLYASTSLLGPPR